MLTQLTIKNFGLIDQVSLEFCAGLNILTGETGAGKSILIDALRCVLGERLDSSSLRETTTPLFIEAVFEIESKELLENPLIAEFITDSTTPLILQRSMNPDGKSRNKINGQTVTLNQLKDLGDLLVDLHGPHDHQLLLDERHHQHMLDQLSGLGPQLKNYSEIYGHYAAINRKIQDLAELNNTQQRELDYLHHQVKELESVPLSQEKYDALLQEHLKISNAEKLNEHLQAALEALNNEENGINDQMRRVFASLRSLAAIDPGTQEMVDLLTQIQDNANDLSARLENYAQSIDYDSASAQKIADQCDAYHEIIRKYGPTLNDAAKIYAAASEKLSTIKDFVHHDNSLKKELADVEKELSLLAAKMSKLRVKTANNIKNSIESELKELGINHVQFEARLESIPFGPSGTDHVVFYISPNAGEDLKPLADIVSSGEAARVMLALKKTLVDVDPVPVLIFDEIDAQIGGRLGSITGKKLKYLSRQRQVILITHLPQIASFADRHFKVSKQLKSGRAVTNVACLDEAARVKELAQMMSGQETGQTALTHAQEMLATAQRIR